MFNLVNKTIPYSNYRKFNHTLFNILFEKDFSINKYTKSELNELFKFAEKSRVLFRLLKKISDNSKYKRQISKNLIRCEKKLEKTVKLIDSSQKVLSKNNIPFSIIKMVVDFPDVGADVDVLILEKDLREAKKAILTLKPDFMEKGIKGSEYYKKEHFGFRFEDISFQTEIELYPKFSSQGETYIPEERIIDRSVIFDYNGIKIIAPSPEDRILITVIHTMFRHGGLIRIMDIINTLDLIENEDLDWNFIYSEAKKYGILQAFLFFVNIINDVCIRYNRKTNLPSFLIKAKKTPFRYDFDYIPFRVPLHLLLLVFGPKFIHDICRLKLSSSVKLARTYATHSAGRFLIFFSNFFKRTSILDRLGLKL